MQYFDTLIDEHYNIVDLVEYNAQYLIIVKDFQKSETYKDYPESSSARNFSVIKELAKDC